MYVIRGGKMHYILLESNASFDECSLLLYVMNQLKRKRVKITKGRDVQRNDSYSITKYIALFDHLNV